MPLRLKSPAVALLLILTAGFSGDPEPVDWVMVARIRADCAEAQALFDRLSP
mgnify:CR=1 FL=1